MFRRFYVPMVLCSEGSIFRRFCSKMLGFVASFDVVVDDMDGVGVKIKKSANVEITARGD